MPLHRDGANVFGARLGPFARARRQPVRIRSPASGVAGEVGRGEARVLGAAAATGKGASAAPAMKEYTNGLGIEFVPIPAGTFVMGSDDGNEGEEPIHRATIGQPFYLGKYPVTQEAWQKS
jgi:formylglycine-generating enzyme required for sulfatase activity